MEAAVRARHSRGEYDAVSDDFAEMRTEHLREVRKDKHLRVNFGPGRASRGPCPARAQRAQHGSAHKWTEQLRG